MSQPLPALALVLEIFALLFSQQWVGLWQKRWRPPKWLAPLGQGRQGKDSRKKPSLPARFYQRIFSLRVTRWYLL